MIEQKEYDELHEGIVMKRSAGLNRGRGRGE